MARYQYRISSPGDWTSNFGFSFLALVNASGSGRKITLRALNVDVLTSRGSATQGFLPCSLWQCATPVSGEDMVLAAAKMDSGATLPSTVVVRRGGAASSYSALLRHVDIARRGGAVGTQNTIFCNRFAGRGALGGLYRSSRKVSAVEAITLPQNTAIALVPDSTAFENAPVRISLALSINAKTVLWQFVSVPAVGVALFTVENTGTDTVKLLDLSVTEVGTSDTPFIRLVRIGQMYAQDVGDTSRKNLVIEKVDSTSPALTALTAYADIGFIPDGSQEVAINAGSTGSPKDLNYLHTRDFNGPCLRTFLPEMRAYSGPGSGSDMWGFNTRFRTNDLLTRRAGIVINPGEGLALVSTAETAVGVQAAYSGWPALQFQAIVDSEPSLVPAVTISGMVDTSRWRVERVSDSSLVATGVSGPSGVATFDYTVEDTPLNLRLRVRKASSAPYYKPYEITFNLTSAGITIPVSQIADA